MANTRQARAHTGSRIVAGIVLIAVSAFSFLCAVGAFGGVGKAVSGFLVGFLGLAVYGYTLAGVILGIALTFGIRVRMRFTRALFYFGLLVLGIMALHVYSSSAHVVDASYGDYLLNCYSNTNTAGGLLFGVVTFPLMKLITSVGALVVFCAAFLVLAFLGLLPSIRRNVTYTAASKKERRAKPARRTSDGNENAYPTRQRVRGETHRIGAADAPTITDFSQIGRQGDESLYVVDVAGDPMPQKHGRKRAKGADGYSPINSFNPLYPNQNGGYEDEMRTPPTQNTVMRASGDEYTSRGVARDILFGQEPNAEVISRYESASNPRSALSNVSPSYDAVRRGEMRNRFSSDSSEALREEFIRRYRENGDNVSDGGGYNPLMDNIYGAREEDKREDLSAKLDFYALKADRERTFAENPIQYDFTSNDEPQQEPQKKEVVKPTRVMRHPDSADAINSTIRKAESAVGSNVNTGMLGALNRAMAGENAPQQPQERIYGEMESESYDVSEIRPQTVVATQNMQTDASDYYDVSQPVRPNVASAANSAIFESNARTAQQKTLTDVEISEYTPIKEGNVPYAFTGTSIDKEAERPNSMPKAPKQPNKQPKSTGYDMPKATLDNTRPAYVDTNPTQGGDMPSEPLPIRQKVTGAPMSRGEIQSTTDIAKQSGKGKESAEMQSRIQNIRQAIKETPAIGQYEREALREEKMKSAQTRGVIDDESVRKPKKADKPVVEKVEEKPAPPPRRPYVAPPVSLLDPPKPEEDQNEDYDLKKERIVRTLNFFNIKCEVKEIKVGPTFTLYKLKVEMPRGKTVSSICAYESDIAMKMEVDNVRIIAPIPGEDAVGVEVPNKIRRIVTLSEIIESPEFNKEKDPGSFAVGKNLYGISRIARVSKLPHVLIAGATGAGKSCCINSLIVSLLYKASPDDVRLILVDPKRVEMTIYAGIPHLLMDEIICDTDKAIRALNWSIQEMERRMKFFAEVGYRDIESYNADAGKNSHDKMARIVIIVDEFADLMSTGKKAVEDSVNRIARLARATGIHIVLATQRPSTDVISGTIKNNLPSRIAFKVTSNYDSRTVIDTVGAEKLLGFGDLMYSTPGSSAPERMQGAYISNDEVRRVVEFIKEHNDSYFDETVKDAIFKEEEIEEDDGKTEKTRGKDKGGLSPDLLDALELGIELREDNNSPLSISYMQRKLGFGYPKAAKIHDQMKEYGFLTDDGTGKKRMIVNISREQLRALREGDTNDEDEE